jgi:uncharacterized protein YggU (UPF0235/DUF167 family)
MVPAPAIKGKASGTIEAELASSSYKSNSKIISSAKKKTKQMTLLQQRNGQFRLILKSSLQQTKTLS